MTKRISTLPVITLADLTDACRYVVYRADGSPARVVTISAADIRSFNTIPLTDHSGSLGTSLLRWGVLYVDTVNAYGGPTAITDSTPLFNGSQTWNDGSEVFVAEDTNITDSASAAGSFLRRWRVGGVVKASIGKDGTITATGFTGPLTGAVTGNTAGTHTGPVVGNVTGNVTGDVSGNAGTASAVAAANLTGTALPAGILASSLTSLGVIAALLATKARTGTFGPTVVGTASPTVIIAATVPAGGYLIFAMYTSNSVMYAASSDGAGNVVVASLVGSGLTIDVSGGAIRVTQASGVNQTVTAFWLRIA